MKTIKGNYKDTRNKVNEIISRLDQNKQKTAAEMEKAEAEKERAESKKAECLLNGDETGYIKASEELEKAEKRLTFLKETKGNIAAISGLTLENLEAIRKEIHKEEKRITAEGLQEVEKELLSIIEPLGEAWDQISEGERIYSQIYACFVNNASLEERKKVSTDSVKYGQTPAYTHLQGINYQLDRIIAFINQPYVKPAKEGR